MQAVSPVLLRQDGQQFLLPGSPALISIRYLAAGGDVMGHGKQKLCCCDEWLHIFVLDILFV